MQSITFVTAFAAMTKRGRYYRKIPVPWQHNSIVHS